MWKVNENNVYLSILAIFSFLLVCNILLMPQSDDIGRYLAGSLGIKGAIGAYMGWNGRFGELLISAYVLNRFAFDIINSFVGAGFIVSFFVLIFGRLPKDSLDSYTLILFTTMTISFTAFGSVYLWNSGALNYLWGYFFITLSLLPYRIFWQNHYDKIESKNDKFAVIKVFFIILCCIVAGWSSEQMGIITIIVHLGFLAYARHKKISLPSWYYAGVVAFIVGWLILYLSPGHAKRASLDVFKGTYLSIGEILGLGIFGTIKRIFQALAFESSMYKAFMKIFMVIIAIYLYASMIRFPNITWKKIAYILGIVLSIAIALILLNNAKSVIKLIMFGLCVYLAYKNRGDCIVNTIWFWIAFLFGLYILASLSTIQMLGLPDRAKYGSDLLLIGILLLLFRDVYRTISLRKYLGYGLLACSVFMWGFVVSAYINYNYKWNSMLSYIESEKQRGNLDIVVPKDTFKSFYKRIGDWGNPGPDPKEWPNNTYAKMLNVDSFKVE